MSDKELLDWYMKGFHDELRGTTSSPEGDQLRAYKIGALHAEMGDDNRSFDNLSDKEILKIIKNEQDDKRI
jgi:hypothetical protein